MHGATLLQNKEYLNTRNLNKRLAKWLKTIEVSSKKRPKLKLRSKNSALLVIDPINHFTDPKGRAYLPASDTILPNIDSIITLYNQLSLPIILTQHFHTTIDPNNMIQRFYSDYIKEGEFDSLLSKKLKLSGKEIIINKDTYDAFWNTELENILRQKGVEQVLISGCLTHLCCETTARSAFVRGFEVYFGADLTFSKTEELHLASLIAIADGFGKVLSLEEIKKCLK